MATTRTTHRPFRPLLLALLAAGVLTATTAMAQDTPCEACDCGHARPPHGAEFDADGDGGLSVDELTAMLLARSEHHAERDEAHQARRQARMERHAAREEGDGEHAERHAARRAEMQARMAEHQARFAAMDVDGDGALSADEAAAGAAALLAEFDTDGDGVLRRDEMPHPGPHARGRRGGGDEEGRRGGRRGGQRGGERGPGRD